MAWRGYRVGDVRVAPYSEYEPGAEGFVIERLGYWNNCEPTWALPDWIEWSRGSLDGIFPTREAAEQALAA